MFLVVDAPLNCGPVRGRQERLTGSQGILQTGSMWYTKQAASASHWVLGLSRIFPCLLSEELISHQFPPPEVAILETGNHF